MSANPKKVFFRDLGKLDYQQAWDIQTQLHEGIKGPKVAARRAGSTYTKKHHLLFVEHNEVYTLGKSGKKEHLLLNDNELHSKGIQYYKINRGGDITYHGAGQITAYPIFDLDDFFHDVHRYVRMLEEVVIDLLSKYDIRGERREAYTGVWVSEQGLSKKVCAIGVHLSRWVTMHGIALNVNTDLTKFDHIIPCGIAEENMSVTSIADILGESIDYEAAKVDLKESFRKVFDLMWV